MNINFSFTIRVENIIIIIIVRLVGSLVCYFREIYIEWYNIKKYFFITIFFYISIVLLILRSRPIVLIIGWDILGITSILLIMFYPNQINISNAYWTIIFNRLGDVSIIIIIRLITQFSLFFFWFIKSPEFYYLTLICVFTKRAQFPISTWLPLAISAPTPISAIVHSSTLVTAGIILTSKFLDLFYFFKSFNIIVIISIITFIIGGFLATIEKDYKKIIAFSTISQIRIIIYLLSIKIKFFCLIHIFIHAMFKRLLFRCSGIKFFYYRLDQNDFIISIKNFNNNLKRCFIIRIYSITGLLFSRSFYTKDYVLEWTFSGFGITELILLLIVGRLLTINYCSKLMKSILSFYNTKSNLYRKRIRKMFPILRVFLLITSSYFIINLIRPNISKINLITLNSIITLIITLNINIKTVNINFINNVIFSNIVKLIILKFYKNHIIKLRFSDNFSINHYLNIEKITIKLEEEKKISNIYKSILIILRYLLLTKCIV